MSTIVGESLCLGIEHRWEETYYGYKCAECGEFVPFGSEPWIDPRIDESNVWYEDSPFDGLVIAVGQKHHLRVPTSEIVVEIKRLDVLNREVEFMVSGDMVEKPEQPRIMPIGTFVKWLDFHQKNGRRWKDERSTIQ